ncbi:MAG: hypothetical protein ABSG41_12405 [Bryobacteraceae bacterium]|jgi:hypothetical protein
MFRYFAFALSIHSEVELPGLPEGDLKPDVVIRFGPVPWIPRQAGMEEEIALHSLAGAFHIRNGSEIIIDPRPDVDPALLRILLGGRIMAFLLRQRGWLPLHASGVEIDGQAILFLGASGSGKSTTVAAFHSRGHHVIADDVGAVRVDDGGQECLLRPAGSRIRLLNESRVAFAGREPKGIFQWDKHLFDVGRNELRDLIRVRCIYLLTDGSELRDEEIPPLAAVSILSANSFVKRHRMNREALAAHLRDCSSVALAVPVYRLVRPRSLQALPKLVRRVETGPQK